MPRALALTLLACVPALSFGVALVGPQRALAQDCFCGAQPQQVPGSVDADAPETPDTTIESSDPEAVAPAESVRAHVPGAPLWCTGSADPRCMPMEPADFPVFRGVGGGPMATTLEMITAMRAPRIARTLDAVTPAEGLAPAWGVTTGIDRPPRR